jgi:hypothetical protein
MVEARRMRWAGLAIGNIQQNQEGLELNAIHQLLAYADNVNILGKNTNTIKESTEVLLDASKAKMHSKKLWAD